MTFRFVGFTALAMSLTACSGLGPSPTLAKYSDAQIRRCMSSLTVKDQNQIQAAVQRAAIIPVVGVFTAQEAQYKEAEKICKRKGIL